MVLWASRETPAAPNTSIIKEAFFGARVVLARCKRGRQHDWFGNTSRRALAGFTRLVVFIAV